MKLPWDKNYLKISFHIIFTLILVYALKLCVDLLAYILTNLDIIYNDIKGFIGWILSIFSVVVIAFIISYLFDPLVEFFQNKYDKIYKKYIYPTIKDSSIFKKYMLKRQSDTVIKKFRTRTAGTIITYVIVFSVIIIAGGILINKISSSGGSNIMESIILFINNSVNDFITAYRKLENILIEYGLFEYTSQYITNFVSAFTGFVKNIGNSIIEIITSFGGGFINVIISIVISFYFLKDKECIKNKFLEVSETFFPKKINTSLKNILGDINAVFSGYIRGTLLDASIMAFLISCGLSILNIDFAIIIGMISGFSNIIPYFGALIGFILAVSVALLGGEPSKAVYAAILLLVLQQIDSIFIVPKVVGESVELSPVLVLIALAVAGELFGIGGMIIAVPLFATIKMFLSRFLDRQKLRKEQRESIQ